MNLFILSYKKPQRKTPIFLLPSLRNLKKAYPVSTLFYFHGPWIQKTVVSLTPVDTGNRLNFILYK